MNMTNAITSIFLSYVLFDQQLKITFRKSSTLPLKKSNPPFFLTPPPKNSKIVSPPHPLFTDIDKSSAPHSRMGGYYAAI